MEQLQNVRLQMLATSHGLTRVRALCPPLCSFLITNHNFSFGSWSNDQLGLLVGTLMSAIGGILLTALLHGELFAMLGAGFQYWIMQPVFWNILQVRGGAVGGQARCREGFMISL